MRKKLTARRSTLQTGEQALAFLKDPDYFRKRRDEWQTAALSAPPPAPKQPAVAPPKPAPMNGTPPSTQTGAQASVPAGTPSTAQASSGTLSGATTPTTTSVPVTAGGVPPAAAGLLTVAGFKVAGTEVRQLFAAMRTSTNTARQAVRSKNPVALAKAKATVAGRLEQLEAVVKPYEEAQQQMGAKAIGALPDGGKLTTGIRSLVAVRDKARLMYKGLTKLR